MIFDQAINIFQIMSSNINFQPFFAYVLTEKRFSFSAQQIGLKREKNDLFFYLSACERTLYSGRNPRGTTRPSLPQSRYTPSEAEKNYGKSCDQSD